MTTVLRVLVVDDDFMVARIHGRFVEQTDGFEVVGTARTGEEALALTAELRPDLLLLDVHLPDLTGLEVLERLRGRGDDVAVVMVTAERGATAVRAALHGGALQYLVKPFEYDDLADRLRTVAATLASLGGAEVDQAAIDRAFGAARAGGPGGAGGLPASLPKGLSAETADLVLAAARRAGEISASETAEQLGLARVTARRYLEHFVDAGTAEVRLQYGGTGRPERRYRVTS
ncbi:response regulator [Pimelobacter simplex]|uniref:Transcriptional regulatory protein n=1 Tax=Nocardioides simplex TaxID=2045 RepID=A0A0A1DQU2_NOCSI|nr:response regulator [Pimelobacter simplex]AIY19791.2 Response regulator CitB of citrate metabolism [Pimelobacter simplex]GEB15610.1 transcriptional regulatory protein [Pimelobacter simplex]SFM57650.1 Response regulator of citrate/malate metabolism [Pimelobacter simplex]